MTKKSTILIVDDDPFNLTVLDSYLDIAGYDVVVAEDGMDGMALAQSSQPTLILLDVLMPLMNGFETCRQLKRMPITRHIPIIFMTALEDIENKVNGFKVGAVDYITKPFQQEELLARVSTQIKIQQLQVDLQARNHELQVQNNKLREAMANIKQLKSLLPICAACKKIRDDDGYWHEVEEYIRTHVNTDFTYGICLQCVHELYPGLSH